MMANIDRISKLKASGGKGIASVSGSHIQGAEKKNIPVSRGSFVKGLEGIETREPFEAEKSGDLSDIVDDVKDIRPINIKDSCTIWTPSCPKPVVVEKLFKIISTIFNNKAKVYSFIHYPPNLDGEINIDATPKGVSHRYVMVLGTPEVLKVTFPQGIDVKIALKQNDVYTLPFPTCMTGTLSFDGKSSGSGPAKKGYRQKNDKKFPEYRHVLIFDIFDDRVNQVGDIFNKMSESSSSSNSNITAETIKEKVNTLDAESSPTPVPEVHPIYDELQNAQSEAEVLFTPKKTISLE